MQNGCGRRATGGAQEARPRGEEEEEEALNSGGKFFLRKKIIIIRLNVY